MKLESIVEYYEANKRVGSIYPFMIVVADTTREFYPILEHFVFSGIAQRPLICRQIIVTPPLGTNPRVFDWASYPEISSAKSLIKFEFAAARDVFEFAISETDKDLHAQLFWSGKDFKFEQIDIGVVKR